MAYVYDDNSTFDTIESLFESAQADYDVSRADFEVDTSHSVKSAKFVDNLSGSSESENEEDRVVEEDIQEIAITPTRPKKVKERIQETETEEEEVISSKKPKSNRSSPAGIKFSVEKKALVILSDEEDEEETPVYQKPKSKKAKKTAPVILSDEEDEEETPVYQKPKSKKTTPVVLSEDEEETPVHQKHKSKKTKKTPPVVLSDEEDEEETLVYRKPKSNKKEDVQVADFVRSKKSKSSKSTKSPKKKVIVEEQEIPSSSEQSSESEEEILPKKHNKKRFSESKKDDISTSVVEEETTTSDNEEDSVQRKHLEHRSKKYLKKFLRLINNEWSPREAMIEIIGDKENIDVCHDFMIQHIYLEILKSRVVNSKRERITIPEKTHFFVNGCITLKNGDMMNFKSPSAYCKRETTFACEENTTANIFEFDGGSQDAHEFYLEVIIIANIINKMIEAKEKEVSDRAKELKTNKKKRKQTHYESEDSD